MKTENNLYVRVLLWAYNRHSGFTRKEMRDALSLDTEASAWVENMFFSAVQERPLIAHLRSIDGNDIFGLTDKGMAASIDYLDLKEARESSHDAMRIAILALVMTIIIGTIQTVVSLTHH